VAKAKYLKVEQRVQVQWQYVEKFLFGAKPQSNL